MDKAFLDQALRHGLSEDDFNAQIEILRTEPRYVKIIRPCTINHGITRLEPAEEKECRILFRHAQANTSFTRFIPASGAASRMFEAIAAMKKYSPLTKDTLSRLRAKTDSNAAEALMIFENLTSLAIFPRIREMATRSGISIPEIMSLGHYRRLRDLILDEDGMNLPRLPKALIDFHIYRNGESRTAFAEHLIFSHKLFQPHLLGKSLHFTISSNFETEFEKEKEKVCQNYAHLQLDAFKIEFSTQSPSTDTLALNEDGSLCRDSNDHLFFRPGGHGSLLKNLQTLNSTFVWVNNIDNIVPEWLQEEILPWRETLAGYAMKLRNRRNELIFELSKDKVSASLLSEAKIFLQHRFSVELPFSNEQPLESTRKNLLHRLERPFRVCAVVPNEDEPGGGPFLVRSSSGIEEPQIVEKVEIDWTHSQQSEVAKSATHFNPVDMLLCFENSKGERFNLENFMDSSRWLRTTKANQGIKMRVLERPGLWNGGMSHWNTAFIELPLRTFNPVKTIRDLLRPNHQDRKSS